MTSTVGLIFNDGGLAYYAHSSYTIYTADGRLFKTAENHISLSDESPYGRNIRLQHPEFAGGVLRGVRL